MAAIELYNRTQYPDEPLIEAAKFAKRVMKVKGDVAVLVYYNNTSDKFLGWMKEGRPYFNDIVPNIKKFANRKYMVSLDPKKDDINRDRKVAMATRDGSNGYILIRVPRPDKRLSRYRIERAIQTIVHEMRHIWQFRNKVEAMLVAGYTGYTVSNWSHYQGYGEGAYYRRKAHRLRPIEIDVRKALEESNYKKNPNYQKVVENLESLFTDEGYKSKKKATKWFNRYGEKASDYRNVKMNTLRNGDKVEVCPCGQKGVHLGNDYNGNIITHIAATDRMLMSDKYYGIADDVRYTQFGHKVEGGKVVGVVEFGHRVDRTDNQPSEEATRVFNSNPYRRGRFYR